jgi:hypothetical protein
MPFDKLRTSGMSPTSKHSPKIGGQGVDQRFLNLFLEMKEAII